MLLDILTWAGDGVGGKKTTRFQPQGIHLIGNALNNGAVLWNADMPAGDAYIEQEGVKTDAILSVVSDGFTTGTNNSVEQSAVDYSCLVFGGDVGRREFTYGNYAGDNATTRAITLGFANTALLPEWFLLWSNITSAAQSAQWRTTLMPSGDGTPNSAVFTSLTGLLDRIFSFAANQVSIDDTTLAAVNATGTTYYWMAISAQSGGDRSFVQISWTGDGAGSGTQARALDISPMEESSFVMWTGDDSSPPFGSVLYAHKGVQQSRHYHKSLGNMAALDEDDGFVVPGQLIIQNNDAINESGKGYYAAVFEASNLDAPTVASRDTRIGHGKMGLRHALRPFARLVEQADSAREADVELRLAKNVEGFVLDQGSTYVATITEEYLGHVRDLVGVRTFDFPDLTRVETLAICRATAGTFFYDITQVGLSARSWDDGLDWWDEQVLDTGLAAYFELESSSDLEETGAITTAFTEAGSPTYQAGLNNNGVLFANSGILSLTDANTASAFDFGTGDFALHLKIKRSNSGVVAGLVQKLSGFDGFDLRLSASNFLEFSVGDGASGTDVVTGVTALTDTTNWHSVSVFRAGGTVYLYLDGQFEASGVAATDVDNTADFQLGLGSGQTFVGMLDQVVFHGSTAKFFTAGGDRPEHLRTAALVYHNNTAGSAALARTPIPSTNTDSWDVGAGFLYVHLPDGSNPSSTVLQAQFGFYLGGRGVVHPNLGADLLTDGGFEATAGTPVPTGFTSWSKRSWGGSSLLAPVTTPRSGTYAASITMAAASTAGFAFWYAAMTDRVAGECYRISGYYRTPGMVADIDPLVWIYQGGQAIDSLGRDLVDTGPALRRTNDEWLGFSFDVVAPAAAFDVMLGAYAAANSRGGQVLFDDVRVRRIYSWQFREPRLRATSLPKLKAGMRDPHFGKAKVGAGSLDFANGDAAFDPALSGLEWENQDVRVRGGGRFSDGEALLLDFMHPGFAARIQSHRAPDHMVKLDLQDARVNIHRPFPPNRFSQFVESALDPAIDGRVKPVLFGADTGVPVYRVGLDANDKPTYLLADPLDAGLHSLQAVYAYTSKDAADQKDTTERVTLVESTDYSKDLTAGTITMLRDVGPIRITDENKELDFSDGTTRLATLTEGLYASWAALAAHIATQMTAAAGGDTISASHSESTHKLTLSSDGATFELQISTGANKDRSTWALLGYDTGADKTGATSYEADDAVFESPEKNLVVRADVTGLKDDSSGSYTGSASSAINLAVDMFAYIWKATLGYPLSAIEAVTRAEARTTANEVIKAYISDRTNTGDIFERLERTSLAVIVIDGSGGVRFKLLRNALPTSPVAVTDRSIVKFEEKRTVADSYATVRVLYDQDASTGAFKNRTVESAETKLNVRPDDQDFVTYLTNNNDAQERADQISTLAASRARMADLEAHGLLDEQLVGDIVTVTRSRAPMAPGGANVGQAYRVRELSIAWLEPGNSKAVLVEHILVPGG